jgi:hypothetical protein
MGQRLELQTLLEEMIAPHMVYFQPPQDIAMTYPCIVYQWDDLNTDHADNVKYRSLKRYQLTVIDRKPDSEIADAVKELPYTRFDRFFVTDGLNHTVFQMFF